MSTSAWSPEVELFEQRMLDTFGMDSEARADEHARGPVSMAYLRNAIDLFERSSMTAQIRKWERDARVSPAGRKRILPLSAILPLMLLHIQMGRGVVYSDIANTLHRRFGAKHLEILGIADVLSDTTDWYHRFWRGLNRIISYIDPYPLPLDGKLSGAEYQARLAHITDGDGSAEHLRNLKRINWLCNQIVLTAAMAMPAEFRQSYRGNCSIDASLVPIAGRPNNTNLNLKRSNPDPFSGRYRRGGDHDGKGASTDEPGYEVETATMVWNRPYESENFASLVTAVGFHRPGQLVGHGAMLVERHKEAFKLDHFLVMADRAYNNGRIDTFHVPVRKAGAELVITYRTKDLGLQGHYRDLILVDGNWYVRSMPEALIEASHALAQLEKSGSSYTEAEYAIEVDRVRARILNREGYRMTPKGLPDADGYQRFTYPLDPPVPHTPVDGKNTITIPMMIPETTAPPRKPGGRRRRLQPLKHLQRFPYKTPEWEQSYGMRNLVESSNSRFKDAQHEDLGNPTKRSGRGYAVNYLCTALSIASFNLRAIAAYLLKMRDAAAPKPIRIRRRKDELGQPLDRLPMDRAPAPPE